jgi:hypothetical protein
MATLSGVSALTGVSGANITISGAGFGVGQAGSTVTIGGITQTIVSWSDTSIVFAIAADDTMGDLIVNLQSQVWCGPFAGPGQA